MIQKRAASEPPDLNLSRRTVRLLHIADHDRAIAGRLPAQIQAAAPNPSRHPSRH
jgi:hypothetical protein